MYVLRHLKLKVEIKDKNNKLMFFGIDDDEEVERYKIFWTKIEELQFFELNALPVYDDRYIENKIRTDGDKV